MDHRRRDRRAVATVAAVDILHHLLAPLVFEIDVDVGGLAPLGGNEAGEEQIVFDRIDRGDLEQIADQRIGRRAAPLAQDRRFARAREANDVVHGQEIMRIFLFADQRQFLVQQRADAFGDTIVETVERFLPDEMFEPVLRVPARRHGFVRVFVGEVVEREIDPRHQPRAFDDRFGPGGEQPCHLVGRFQVALGVGGEAATGALYGHAFVDAGNDIVERADSRIGIEGIAGGDQRYACAGGKLRQSQHAAPVAAPMWHGDAQPDAVGCDAGEDRQRRSQTGVGARRWQDRVTERGSRRCRSRRAARSASNPRHGVRDRRFRGCIRP